MATPNLCIIQVTLNSLVISDWKPLARIKGKIVQWRLGLSRKSAMSSMTNTST